MRCPSVKKKKQIELSSNLVWRLCRSLPIAVVEICLGELGYLMGNVRAELDTTTAADMELISPRLDEWPVEH